MLARPYRWNLPVVGSWPGRTVLVSCLFAISCNSPTRVGWFAGTTLAEDLRIALDDPSPDQRRNAVVRIGKRANADGQAVFDVLSTVARTDATANVRSAAVRVLGAKMAPQAVPPLVTILLHDEHPDQTLPPNDTVLWDTILVLDMAADRELIPTETRENVRNKLIKILIGTKKRNVRIAAAGVLRHFFHRDVLIGLIGALREEDFGIVYAAEEALVSLTGETHDFDADAWSAWLKEVEDPFVGAGLMPPGFKKEKPGVWQRAWTGTKQFFTPDPQAEALR